MPLVVGNFEGEPGVLFFMISYFSSHFPLLNGFCMEWAPLFAKKTKSVDPTVSSPQS